MSSFANMHAITAQERAELKKNTKDLIACTCCRTGSKKATIFLQSDVHEHAELGWIMTWQFLYGRAAANDTV